MLVRTGSSWANNFFHYCIHSKVHLRREVNKHSEKNTWSIKGICDCALRKRGTATEVEIEIPLEMLETMEKISAGEENATLSKTRISSTNSMDRASFKNIRPQLLFDIADSS